MSELIQKVIDSAIGQWPFIFSHLGIETPPSGKHGPCPICGGRDRFHFDNKEERGTWHCRQCEGQVAGYGLNLVSKFFDIPLYDSALKVANLLGINTYSPTTTENNLYSRNRDIAKDKEAIRTNNKHQAASKRASAIWDNAAPADPEHVYLQKKGIKPNGARQLTSTVTNGKTSFPPNTLVIPVKDNENNLSSLEFIQGNLKQGLAGGLRKGGQLILGDPSSAKNIWITEGFATGATVHQLTGEPVIIAFTANNLPKIVISAKHQFHWATLSIAGDDDTTGRKQAEIAVQNTNYKIKVPPFNAKEVLEINTSGKRMFTDWNDYFVLHGASTTLEALSSMPQSSSENELAQQSDEILHLTSYNPTTATGNSVTNCNTGESEEVLFDDNPTLMPPEPHLMISTSDRDSNIASFIANKIKGKYAISSEESEIYRWDDSAGFWVQYGTQAKCLEQIAFEELKRHVGNEGFNTAKIGSVAGMLQYTLERIPVSDTSNIIFKNGVLDPSNGVFTPCSVKNIYARYSTGVDYIATDGSANFCPTFMDYINFISGSYDQTILKQRSTDRVRILKAILVMVLLRKYDWQLFVEIIGPGGTSKSTFAAMISLLVGQSSVKTIEAKDLEIPERRVNILNAALLYLPDMETYQGEGSGLKKITGGDPLSCRRLYGPSFSAHIRAIVLAVNNTPMRFTDHGGAISRRRVLLLLGQVVPIEKRDPNFISKLRREIPAIIQYLTAWIQEIGGINAVRKILTDATYGEDAKDILTDSDPMTGFAKDLHYANEVRCQVGGAPSSKHPSLPRMYLFHAYLKYCEFYNYETRITQRSFSSSFEVAAKRFGSVTRAKVNGKSIFKGVTIHDNANLQPEWM